MNLQAKLRIDQGLTAEGDGLPLSGNEFAWGDRNPFKNVYRISFNV